MKQWIAIALLCVTSPAWAGEALLSWQPPVGSIQCVDSPEPANVVGYRIWQLVAEINDIEQTELQLTGLKPGEYSYTSSAFREDGESSQLSNMATKVVTEMAVIDDTVFTFIKSPYKPDEIIFLPIGTIPVGTACDHDQPVGSYFVIPRDQVEWSGNIKPDVVVAECS